MINFIGALVLLKIVMMVWLCFTMLMFTFTAKPNKDKMDSFNMIKQATIITIDSFRHKVRRFYGKIIPLKHEYFENLSEEQKKTLPDPNKALFKIGKDEDKVLAKSAVLIRGMQHSIENLVDHLVNHFTS